MYTKIMWYLSIPNDEWSTNSEDKTETDSQSSNPDAWHICAILRNDLQHPHAAFLYRGLINSNTLQNEQKVLSEHSVGQIFDRASTTCNLNFCRSRQMCIRLDIWTGASNTDYLIFCSRSDGTLLNGLQRILVLVVNTCGYCKIAHFNRQTTVNCNLINTLHRLLI